MPAQLLDGRQAAKEKRIALKKRAIALQERGITPSLAVILVGDDPASQIYVHNKERDCLRAGIRSLSFRLPAETTQAELEARIDALNADDAVHGILVQLPLPRHLDELRVIERISPAKDVDGFHPINAGKLLTGLPGIVPCTPRGVMALIARTGVPLAGKQAVVIGRSNTVGKPTAVLLLRENATVTVCHSRTPDLAAYTRNADVLVAAVGRPRTVTGDMIKPGAIVIDVGINRVDDTVVGDVDFDSAAAVAGFITPVPGGVGPMTIAMLLENTLEAAERSVAL